MKFLKADNYAVVNAIVMAERLTSDLKGHKWYEQCLMYRNGVYDTTTNKFSGNEVQLTEWTFRVSMKTHVEKLAQVFVLPKLNIVEITPIKAGQNERMLVIARDNEKCSFAFFNNNQITAGIVSLKDGLLKNNNDFPIVGTVHAVYAPSQIIASVAQQQEMKRLAKQFNAQFKYRFPKYENEKNKKHKIELVTGEHGKYYKVPNVKKTNGGQKNLVVEWALEIDPFVAQRLLERNFLPIETGYPIPIPTA